MAGSEAEERLRAKAEKMARLRWPKARIVHELQLEQGGVRIDLAAIDENWLAVIEIKSERDVLKRLPRQAARSLQIADEVIICAAAKHAAALAQLVHYPSSRDFAASAWAKQLRLTQPEALIAWRTINQCKVYIEEGEAGELRLDTNTLAGAARHLPDPRERLDLLWAGELRSALSRHFGGAALPGSGSKLPRAKMIRTALEHMTGAEMRRAICTQLQQRRFPRADTPADLEPSDG